MRVFVTGATGFIGTAVVRELKQAGHAVVGLARNGAAAAALRRLGAQPHPGDLDDPDSLRTAAARADGVIHLAFMHGLSKASWRRRLYILAGGAPGGLVQRFLEVTTGADRRAIDALGAALQGSGRPLVATFGTLGLAATGVMRDAHAVETDGPDPASPGHGRAITESALDTWAGRGVRTAIVRLPPTVHGAGDGGLVPQMIRAARRKRVSAFVDEGYNRWPAVHRDDAARLFRLALERGSAGARYHGVAEEGIAMRDIAGAIGRRLDVPVSSMTPAGAAKHFGWLGPFVALDNPSSSRWTRERLGWQPSGPSLFEDLDAGGYFRD